MYLGECVVSGFVKMHTTTDSPVGSVDVHNIIACVHKGVWVCIAHQRSRSEGVFLCACGREYMYKCI